MKKITVFLFVMLMLCANVFAQTLSVTTELAKGTSSGDVVSYGGTKHALAGANVKYTIDLSKTDSIAKVNKFTYSFNGQSGNVGYTLSKGNITITPVSFDGLSATESEVTFECSMEYLTKKNGKDTTIIVKPAYGDPIRIYAKPEYSLNEPYEYVFYKDVYSCRWTLYTSGGSSNWQYSWKTSDGKSGSSSYYNYTGSNSGTDKKTVDVTLSLKNYAPDGVTVWYSKSPQLKSIEIYPEATVTLSEEINSSNSRKELFQDQTWKLSVTNTGGYPTGWKFVWTDENGKEVGTGSSYPMSSDRSKNEIKKQVTLSVANYGIKTDGTKEAWLNKKTYTWYATFVPCPVVELARDNYKKNLIYGDTETLSFVITDDDGNSLLNDPRYTWKYSWNYYGYDYKDRDSFPVTADNNTNINGDSRTVTLYVAGTLENGKKYETSRSHTFMMWPTPNIQRSSSSPSYQDACGGQTVKLKVDPLGGVKDGWRYSWYKDGKLVASGSSATYEANIELDTPGFTNESETYKVVAKNYCEGEVRYDNSDKPLSYQVMKYPKPVVSSTFNIYDTNRGKNVETGVRSGNTLALSIDNCYGGYWVSYDDDRWTYQWSKDNQTMTTQRKPNIQASMLSGYEMSVTDQNYTLNVQNTYADGTLWANDTLDKNIKVYRRPEIPISLIRKGNGTSCTFIAKTSLSDSELSRYDYYLVFGYTDRDGIDHPQKEVKQETGTIRFDSFDESTFNNSGNTFWVYSLWKYADGPYITSGKCYTNGTDENWDGSAFTAAEIASRAFDNSTDGIIGNVADVVEMPDYLYTLSGEMIPRSQAKAGVYIVNGKKVLVK